MLYIYFLDWIKNRLSISIIYRFIVKLLRLWLWFLLGFPEWFSVLIAIGLIARIRPADRLWSHGYLNCGHNKFFLWFGITIFFFVRLLDIIGATLPWWGRSCSALLARMRANVEGIEGQFVIAHLALLLSEAMHRVWETTNKNLNNNLE